MSHTKELSDFAGDGVFDSRDVQERIDELESDVEDVQSQIDGLTAPVPADVDTTDAATPDEIADKLAWLRETIAPLQEELTALQSFRDEAEGYAADKFRDGITFIADEYFTEYAEQYANDVCEMPRDAGWPFRHIDWQAAADELRQDYTSIELDGNTFWYR